MVAAADVPRSDVPARCRVVGIPVFDRLDLRAGPGRDHHVVGRIPPWARGIACVGSAPGGWARIRWLGRTGWVERRHLASDTAAPPPAPTFQVSGIAEDEVLNVRAGPCLSRPVVGVLAADARGIRHDGPTYEDWWRIVHHRAAGWVDARHLAPEPVLAPALDPARGLVSPCRRERDRP